MSILSKKTFATAIAAATLGFGVAATSTPAAAWGHHHHGGWGGPAIGFGAGLPLGGAFSGPRLVGPYASDCYFERRPVTNRFGQVVGFRRIRVCD